MAPHTLITGANGFVGSTAVALALSHGHRVTGAVRSLSSGKALEELHPEWDSSKLDFVEVKDYAQEGVFDEIFKKYDFDYVLHIAAPVLDNPANTDFARDFERPSIEGNTQLLKSAKKFGKNVKAISVTGSINAITTGDAEDLKTRVINDKEWLALSRDDAISMQNSYISYCVGKKAAEQAIWDFVEKEKPSFHVTNFCPPLIFGPPLQKVKDMGHINFSTDIVYSFISGKAETVPPTMFPAFIDVRDLIQLHIDALTTPAAANKRFVVGHPFKNQDIADALKKLPEFRDRLPKDNNEPPRTVRLDTAAVEKALPIKYRSPEETYQDTAKHLAELEKK